MRRGPDGAADRRGERHHDDGDGELEGELHHVADVAHAQRPVAHRVFAAQVVGLQPGELGLLARQRGLALEKLVGARAAGGAERQDGGRAHVRRLCRLRVVVVLVQAPAPVDAQGT